MHFKQIELEDCYWTEVNQDGVMLDKVGNRNATFVTPLRSSVRSFLTVLFSHRQKPYVICVFMLLWSCAKCYSTALYIL